MANLVCQSVCGATKFDGQKSSMLDDDDDDGRRLAMALLLKFVRRGTDRLVRCSKG